MTPLIIDVVLTADHLTPTRSNIGARTSDNRHRIILGGAQADGLNIAITATLTIDEAHDLAHTWLQLAHDLEAAAEAEARRDEIEWAAERQGWSAA